MEERKEYNTQHKALSIISKLLSFNFIITKWKRLMRKKERMRGKTCYFLARKYILKVDQLSFTMFVPNCGSLVKLLHVKEMVVILSAE